jgi:CDGSH-type Zn-finger protein/uncharacterized Fe-S cluster protein YjdI
MKPASHRDQLVAMLCEAAEVEHCLMCTYLYGAFSLKQRTDEGLTEAEQQAVRRWRATVIDIAIDEMLHLALVNNLLISIGATPHYGRFNFPINPGVFPADVAVALAPFDPDMLDHFIYLERPRDSAERDGAIISKARYHRGVIEGRLMPFADDYDTVGELYEGIAASFAALEEQHAGAAIPLFIGPKSAQLSESDFRLPGLQPVASAADVRHVVDLIVHQGEGSIAATAESHYAKFRAIRAEWRALHEARKEFVPYRAAARDPVMRPPVVPSPRVHVIANPAAPLLDLGNAAYGLMLRLMTFMPDDSRCPRAERPVAADQVLLLMRGVTAIGSRLTELPARPGEGSARAGLTFTLSRGPLGFGSAQSARTLLAERSSALVQGFRSLASEVPELPPLADQMDRFVAHWSTMSESTSSGAGSASTPASTATAAGTATATVTAASAKAAAGADSAAAAAPSPKVDVAVGREVTVRFDHGRCVHSRACVLGEPNVFKANTPGEWIYPDQATVQRLAIVANNCPSGAISYQAKDPSRNEQAPPVNLVRIRENGPLAFHATLEVNGRADGFRATLCRCGQSQNKPYCDGSHVNAHFEASGEPVTAPSEPLAVRDGPLAVTPTRNGPLEVRGNMEVVSGTGRTVARLTKTWLCRCGGSKKKPYCDGSHRAIGFTADGT